MAITIYRTEGGTLVGVIEYTAHCETECEERRVIFADTPDSFLPRLEAEAVSLVPSYSSYEDENHRRAKALGIVRRLVATAMRDANVIPTRRIA